VPESAAAEPLSSVIDRVLAGHDALTTVAHTLDDEWQYVTDLAAVWRGRLVAVASARGREPVAAPIVAAADRALDEIARIADPHRAIDWLSTFPQLILLAIGEEDRPPPGPAPA
jgi:hypothetical protein